MNWQRGGALGMLKTGTPNSHEWRAGVRQTERNYGRFGAHMMLCQRDEQGRRAVSGCQKQRQSERLMVLLIHGRIITVDTKQRIAIDESNCII